MIDTRAKREAAIGVSIPIPSLFPQADNEISLADRYTFVWHYYHDPAIVTPPSLELTARANIRFVAEARSEI